MDLSDVVNVCSAALKEREDLQLSRYLRGWSSACGREINQGGITESRNCRALMALRFRACVCHLWGGSSHQAGYPLVRLSWCSFTAWWFGNVWNHGILWLSIQLGMSSSQLTKSIIFQRGSSTTKQFRFLWKKSISGRPGISLGSFLAAMDSHGQILQADQTLVFQNQVLQDDAKPFEVLCDSKIVVQSLWIRDLTARLGDVVRWGAFILLLIVIRYSPYAPCMV